MTCTTHHNACDCREAAHAAEVERLTAIVAAADALREATVYDTGIEEEPRLCIHCACGTGVGEHADGCVVAAYDMARGER